MNWQDVSSLRLHKGQWCLDAYSLSSAENDNLAELKMQKGKPFRYVPQLQIGTAAECCSAVMQVDGGSAGCRIVGDIITQLSGHYASVDNIPLNIYLSASSGFLTRGLLTLYHLANPETRLEFSRRYHSHTAPAINGESNTEYEARAVELIGKSLVGFQQLEPKRLFIKGIRSKPDGLFLNKATGTLAVIEAKKREADFAEGTAQLVQYYAQARNHAEFLELTVESHLITSEAKQTLGYKVWETLMQSAKTLRFLVPEQ